MSKSMLVVLVSALLAAPAGRANRNPHGGGGGSPTDCPPGLSCTYSSGLSCQGGSNQAADYFFDATEPPAPVGSTFTYLLCPAPAGSSATVRFAGARVFLRIFDPGDRFACTVQAVDVHGSSWESATVTSRAGSGLQVLEIPGGLALSRDGQPGAAASSVAEVVSWGVSCRFQAGTSGYPSIVSGIAGYQLMQQP